MRVVYSILIVLFLYACKDKVAYEKPEGLISKSQMTDLLYDMHMVIGTSNIQNVHLEKNRNYMSLVYEKYGIDSTQFAISNLYYTAHVQDYEEIFEEVERRIQNLKDEMMPNADSIAGISRNARRAEQYKDSIERALNLKD